METFILEIYKMNKGQFSFESFNIQGRLSSSVFLSIYVSSLNTDNKTTAVLIPNKNEQILNSTYYYVIKVSFTKQCNLGQYYDSTLYLFFFIIYNL